MLTGYISGSVCDVAAWLCHKVINDIKHMNLVIFLLNGYKFSLASDVIVK